MMPNPSVRRIELDDPLYQKERDLRNRILLRPIGIPDHAWEMNDARSWHFAALHGEQLIGCVVLVPLESTPKKAQLIQMAVETNWQRMGIGILLVRALLEFAGLQGIGEILIHARANTTGFYSKFGFETYGDAFVEVGVLHRHMRLLLK